MKSSREAREAKKDVDRKKAKLQETQGVVMPTFAAPLAETSVSGGSAGLLTVEEFRRKREQMVREASEHKAQAAVKQKAESARAAKAARARRSFALDDDEDEGGKGGEKQEAIGVGKDPSVETSFLPDKAREEEEERLRRELGEQWREQQQRVKSEPLVVVFSFWDGKGTRRAHRLPRGHTVGQFLREACGATEELRGVAPDSLVFVASDYIVPHHFSFYELLMARTAGGAAVFDFGEDAGGHAAKVCERRWYEQNKHIFPASKWIVYGR